MMRCLFLFIALWSIYTYPITVSAQEAEPAIIPENLQRLAIKFPIAARLGIKWESADVSDVGRYMSLLAGINEVASEIAEKEGRNQPQESDFIAAISIFCIFPPNKPPLIESYWPNTFDVFSNKKARIALKNAVGDGAVQISRSLAKYNEVPQRELNYMYDERSYNKILDINKYLDAIK